MIYPETNLDSIFFLGMSEIKYLHNCPTIGNHSNPLIIN